MEIGLDDWTVQIRRIDAEITGEAIQEDIGGPYVTIGVFRGPDAESKARSVVDRMNRLAPGYCWAWSGRDILAERESR